MNTVLIAYPSGTSGGFPGGPSRGRRAAPGTPEVAQHAARACARPPFPAPDTNRAPAPQAASETPAFSRPADLVETYTRTVLPLTGLLVSVARRILGDDAQAWDAVQEALIRLWNTGEIPPNPRAWLTRAVVLRSLHLARSRARRRRHELRACDRHPEASDRDDPSRSLEYEELAQTLDEAFQSIPPEYREVLLLRTVAHMDYASIAEALRIPVGTVRSRLNRTRQFLREVLSEDVLNDDDLVPCADGPG